MSRKFAEQHTRERAGETWDNALLYAFKKEVPSALVCAHVAQTGGQSERWRRRAPCTNIRHSQRRRVYGLDSLQVEYSPEFSPSDGLLILHVHEVQILHRADMRAPVRGRADGQCWLHERSATCTHKNKTPGGGSSTAYKCTVRARPHS